LASNGVAEAREADLRADNRLAASGANGRIKVDRAIGITGSRTTPKDPRPNGTRVARGQANPSASRLSFQVQKQQSREKAKAELRILSVGSHPMASRRMPRPALRRPINAGHNIPASKVRQPALPLLIATSLSIPARKGRPREPPLRIAAVLSTRGHKALLLERLPRIAGGLSTRVHKEQPLVRPSPIGISRRSRALQVQRPGPRWQIGTNLSSLVLKALHSVRLPPTKTRLQCPARKAPLSAQP